MGNELSSQNKSTQTKEIDITRFRRVVSLIETDPDSYHTKYPNTKATQTEDEYTVSKKYQLRSWRLKEKLMPLCAECLTCNCTYDCSTLTTEDIVVLFKMLRKTNDTFEQFAFLAQHIKLDPYRYKAQFYVRIKREGSWVIRRTCLNTFRHIFRISNLELSELVKRIANYIKEKEMVCDDTNESDVDDELSEYSQQGFVITYWTVTKQLIRREIEEKWTKPNFKPDLIDWSFLECFGFSNCYCNCSRTIRHYLFYCPRYDLIRKEILQCSSVEELFKNDEELVRFVQEFVFKVTSPPQ